MKRLLSVICVFMALVTLLCSCKEKDEAVKTDTKEATEVDTEELILSDDMLYIVAGAKARYGIVRATNMSSATFDVLTDMHSDISERTGVKIQFIDDKRTLKDGIEEILVGNTSRKESETAMAQLGDDHWSVSVQNGKLCIVGLNDVALAKAINAFSEAYVNVESENSASGLLAVPKGISLKGKLTEDIHALYVGDGVKLEVDAVTKFKFNVLSFTQDSANLKWVQGGCTDGQYLYQFMISTDSTSCVIVKFDIESGALVKKSSVLNLGHANDAAYNQNDNTIVIADCMSPDYNKVYILDADTLTITDIVELEKNSAPQLTYNQATCQYITANNSKIYFWDEDFNLLRTCAVGLGNDYHTQGMVCDGTYIYRLEYWQNPNNTKEIKNNLRIIRASDGKEMTIVDIGIAREAEFIIIYEDMFYVGCNNSTWSGSEVYAFKLIPQG